MASRKVVRFAVGSTDGLTSHSWRVWTEKKSELYLACRDAFKDTKVSLHASGRWRMGFTSKAVRENPKLIEGDRDRAWEVWDKPPPVLPDVVVAFSMYFPASEFVLSREQRLEENWKDVQYIPAARDGFTTVVSLCIADSHMGVEHSGASSELGVFDLADGKCVRLIAHDTVDIDVVRVVNEQRAKMLSFAQANRLEVPADTFGYFLGHRPDGTRNLIGVKWPIEGRCVVVAPQDEFSP